MIYKINFRIPGYYPDYFILKGDTREDIRKQIKNFFKSRGLDIDECYISSEKLEGD